MDHEWPSDHTCTALEMAMDHWFDGDAGLLLGQTDIWHFRAPPHPEGAHAEAAPGGGRAGKPAHCF